MLKLNERVVEVGHFADGTQHLKVEKYFGSEHKIEWKYESDEELVTLIFIVKHIREKDKDANIILNLWYIPNARQDRIKGEEEVFTLKYFAGIINSLNFKRVRVMDAHSYVSLGLLDRVEDTTPAEYIKTAINNIFGQIGVYIPQPENLVLYFPDDGAAKRYKSLPALSGYEVVYGKKVRDWDTREITELKVVSDSTKCVSDIIKDKKILVIDDIISSGNTIYKGTKILKELGAGDIYAFASHVENPDREGYGEGLKIAFKEDCIKKVYTTNSLYPGGNEKITIINI